MDSVIKCYRQCYSVTACVSRTDTLGTTYPLNWKIHSFNLKRKRLLNPSLRLPPDGVRQPPEKESIKQGQVTTQNISSSVKYNKLSFFQTFIPQGQSELVPIQQFDYFSVCCLQKQTGNQKESPSPVQNGGVQENHREVKQARTERKVIGSKPRYSSMKRFSAATWMSVSVLET